MSSPSDSSSTNEFVLWILQCLDEEKCEETVHKLEKESGLYFNMKYFEDLVTNGDWEKVEAYLSGFTKLEDNGHSEKIFHEIRKQKYYEVLDRAEHSKALLTYGDFKSARAILLEALKMLIETNPVFEGKLQFPSMQKSTLKTLYNQALAYEASEELPKTVVANLSQGSTVKSMEFHPLQHSLLLVGTNIGDISIWEVGIKELRVHRKFEVWKHSLWPFLLEISLTSGYSASVNRVIWSLDGELFGVAYSKNIVHIYNYLGGTELRNHLEIDAHAGNVSDLAFTILDKQLRIITCGDDKTIKVWDATSGSMLLTFEGHEAPVYSVCPYLGDDKTIKLLFSTSVDGKIKAWLYDQKGSIFDYNAPGFSSTRMSFSSDKTRLFYCGINKERGAFIVEWDEIIGHIKRSYIGLGKTSNDAIQFDTARNKFLAAGDESVIKIWDMDNVNLLRTIDAEGGLPATPYICFNKEGTLLAVSTADNGIKVLASTNDVRPVHSIASPSGAAFGSLIKNGDNQTITDVNRNIENSKTWCSVINDSSQLCALRLADHTSPVRIMRLMYLTSGDALLALTHNANHKLWKRQNIDCNATGEATSGVAPQLMMLPSGVLMTNDTGQLNPDFASCFVLFKKDHYLMSTSGGKISLFNMMEFKTIATFMPSSTATSLAYHPRDNDILAIGMDDSTIDIFNVPFNKVTSKLKGHKKRVTGLAFSNVLNVLVSSSADSQICIWSIGVWEKKASLFLHMPTGRTLNSNSSTRVQFFPDQVHLLAVHETQVAICRVPTQGMKQPHMKKWFPPESSGAITDAACSCDSKSVFVSCEDGSVAVLAASTMMLWCIINKTAYLPYNPSNRTFPVALAAHPSEPNQFALGLSDGRIHVLEPLDSKAK